jgi:hypothetical protein
LHGIALGQHTEWATAGREVAEVHTEGDTDAIAVGDSRDCALDVATGILGVEEPLGGESSSVDDSWGVVLNDGSVAKDSSNRNISGLGAGKTKESGRQDREDGCGMHFESISEFGGVRKGEGNCNSVSIRYLEIKRRRMRSTGLTCRRSRCL